jgi:uncharacterized protein (DUF111 family)
VKIAYFDCFSGISGDMCLGALISAGVDFDLLKEELAKMPVKGYDFALAKRKKNGIPVPTFLWITGTDQPERHLADILQIIDGSACRMQLGKKQGCFYPPGSSRGCHP